MASLQAGDKVQTIKEAAKNIALLWQRPRQVQGIYRPMKFLLKAQVEEGLLLYNVITSEMVLLDNVDARFFDGPSEEYNPAMDELIARHFLVPDSFDENKSVEQLRALIKKLEITKRVNGFTILPTTECNARCYYCFESDHPHCTMTDQIVTDTVSYIADKCKGEPIEITWFGGEPMVASKRISQICKGLRVRGIRYRSSMVSNAYLFDESLIQTAKDDWHLTMVQITLDGTEKVYNETKAYIQPRDNPYQRVLQNIDALLEQGIAVNVRLNVTVNNAENLSDLVDELDIRFGGKKGFTAYSHEVFENVGYNPLYYDGNVREQVYARASELDAKLRQKKLLGSLAKLPGLRIMHCMADNDSCRVIYPDGSIGKCENMSSLESVGDIYQDITDQASNSRCKLTKQFPGCADCPLFPSCINLMICPETGYCSKIKVEWKLDRYTGLIKNVYQRYLQNGHEGCPEKTTQSECGL